MFAISFRFINNCYHATPWGRDPNEAAVSWPPAPWSILRALVAVYWRKADRERWKTADLRCLINTLADSLPVYRLPHGTTYAHTRHYMPTGKIPTKESNATTLIFDAFIRLPKGAEVIAAWPEVELEQHIFDLASSLASSLSYFGRAESWTDCTALKEWVGNINCRPAEAQLCGDPIHLLSPRRPAEYNTERARIIAEATQLICASEQSGISNQKIESKIKNHFLTRQGKFDTLPSCFLNAISLDPLDYHRKGWNRPPAAYEVLYDREKGTAPGLLHLNHRSKFYGQASQSLAQSPTIARFLLVGRPRPRIENAIKIGEAMRRAALVQFGNKDSGSAEHPIPAAPRSISGHDDDGQPLKDPSHSHAFWLPEDADSDGWIDHLSIFVAAGIDNCVLTRLNEISYLSVGNRKWQVVLEGFGTPSNFAQRAAIFGNSTHWRSITPFLSSGHLKAGGYRSEVLRLLKRRGSFPFAGVEISYLESRRRSIDFHRFRSRSRELQPDTKGAFLEIIFPQKVSGPLAIGYGSHFGLGLFSAYSPGEN